MVIDSFEFDMSYSVKSIAPFYFTEKKFSLNSKESQNLNVSLLVCKKINPFLSKGVRPILAYFFFLFLSSVQPWSDMFLP